MLLYTFLDPTSDYYNENVIGVKTGSLSDDYNLVVLYQKYGKEFLICSLGSQSDSSRYDNVSNILKTIDESDYLKKIATKYTSILPYDGKRKKPSTADFIHAIIYNGSVEKSEPPFSMPSVRI